ncbi:hypothetical protein [Changchengzhania lutea]|nr:hypothetical protein [Changchengzhania lutea]
MKKLTKVFALTLMVFAIGLTSCTKQDLNQEEVQIEKDEPKETDI